MNYSSEKQAERRQRGEAFQAEVRRSWALVPNCWRMRIADENSGTRPGDELVILADNNLLLEHKRTASNQFQLGYLTPGEIKGLLDFEVTSWRNLGLVFVSFKNDEKGLDLAVALRLRTAMQFMREQERKMITLDQLRKRAIPCIWLPRIELREGTGYDLKGVVKKCKSL